MKLHHSSVFAVMVLLLPVSSMSADSTSPAPPNIAGCYELSTMTWEPAPVDDIKYMKYLIVPKQIWLTSIRTVEGLYVLLPAPGQPQTFHNSTYWQIDPREGVLLRWAAGPAQVGLRIILQPPSEPGKPMKGLAKPSFEIEKPYKDMPITATKVSCRLDFPE